LISKDQDDEMIRKSMTEWEGDGPTGSGSLSTESDALRAQLFEGDAIRSIAPDFTAGIDGPGKAQAAPPHEVAKNSNVGRRA
jgi:hypothetical protein